MNIKYDQQQSQQDFVRCTFGIRGERPVLMKVDRLNDTLDSLICILVNKFNLDPSQKYWLTLETGAIIEDITDLDKEDIVIIEKYATAYRPFPMFKEKKKKALKSRFVDPAPAYQYQPSYDPAYSMYPMYENINYNPNIPLMNSGLPGNYMEFPKYEGVDFNNEANNDRTNDLTEDTKASNSSNKSSQSSQNMQPKSKSLSFYTQIDSYSANQSQMFKKVGNEGYYEQAWNLHQQVDIGSKFLTLNFFNADEQYKEESSSSDIMQILDKKFYDRNEMIDEVRKEARKIGFNICIPRGDTMLNDGTEQVILYCDKYGIKRRRSNDGKERYSKKTDCKWRIKFQKRAGYNGYELAKGEINEHNHSLNPFMSSTRFSRSRSEVGVYSDYDLKRDYLASSSYSKIYGSYDDNDILCENSILLDKCKQDELKFSKKREYIDSSGFLIQPNEESLKQDGDKSRVNKEIKHPSYINHNPTFVDQNAPKMVKVSNLKNVLYSNQNSIQNQLRYPSQFVDCRASSPNQNQKGISPSRNLPLKQDNTYEIFDNDVKVDEDTYDHTYNENSQENNQNEATFDDLSDEQPGNGNQIDPDYNLLELKSTSGDIFNQQLQPTQTDVTEGLKEYGRDVNCKIEQGSQLFHKDSDGVSELNYPYLHKFKHDDYKLNYFEKDSAIADMPNIFETDSNFN